MIAYAQVRRPARDGFTASISLQAKAAVQLKLFNAATNQIYNVAYKTGSDTYSIPVSLNIPAGTYVLLLETPKGATSMKVIIL